MRIAFLVPDVDGPDEIGASVLILAGALAADHDVTVLSVAAPGPAPRWADPRVVVERDVDAARALPRLDVDAVVTLSPALLALAVTVAGDDVLVVHQEHRPPASRGDDLATLLTHAPRADVVVLPTVADEAWLVSRLGAHSPRTVVLPHPVLAGPTPRSTLEPGRFVAAGPLVREKQLGRLVEAFALVADDLPHWRLRICGAGPHRSELVGQLRKWGLTDRVDLPGAVDDVTAEWAAAAVAVSASRVEGAPLALQQAMAAGVPAIAFDCPSTPRAVIEHDANGLLVAPQSVNGLAAALLRVATDDDLRHRLGRGALESARAWAPDVVATRWSSVLAAGARRGSSRPAPPAAEPGAPTGYPDGATPARARHEALAWAVAAARAASDTWLVVPAHERPGPTVIVPIAARDGVLAALAGPDRPDYLCLRDPADKGWPERRGAVDVLATELRGAMTSTVMLEPWPEVGGEASLLAQDCTVTLEFWEAAPDGTLVSPRRSPYTDRLPLPLETVDAEVEGVAVRTLALMLAPTVAEATFPVDVVYTWVDGNDAAWDDARRARLADLTGTAQTRESSGRARFVDRGELRYSMRSLHLFAPWVRRIHLVTAGQVPPWLDVDHPAIHLVDHRDLLPAEALPTFNSHAIESVLHRIDGLAEHFVYLNDDMLLGRPVRPETFFSPSGLTSVFLSTLAVGLSDAPGAAPFSKAAWNNRALLQEAFGAVVTHHLAHAPYAHRVSVLRELSARFAGPLAATTRSPFRSDSDVSTLSSLAQHYGLLTGTAYVGDLEAHPLAFINLSNSGVDRLLRQALERRQDFLCLGDHHDHALGADSLDRALGEFFERYYPVIAPWELTAP